MWSFPRGMFTIPLASERFLELSISTVYRSILYINNLQFKPRETDDRRHISKHTGFIYNMFRNPCTFFPGKTHLQQSNKCPCTPWPYSQSAAGLFVCIPNFGQAVIQIFHCMSKKMLSCPQHNALPLHKFIRHKISLLDLFPRCSQAAICIFQR